MATSITHSHRQLKQMRPACQLAAETLVMVGRHLRPGMTTEEVNTLVHEYTLQHDAIPAPLNYKGFPRASAPASTRSSAAASRAPGCCAMRTSCRRCHHHLPRRGGYHGDTSATFYIGEPCPWRATSSR